MVIDCQRRRDPVLAWSRLLAGGTEPFVPQTTHDQNVILSAIQKTKRGRPLGLMSTGKKLAVPNSFFGPSFLPENPFCKALLEPVISSFDSGSFWLRHVSQRGDPFSHPSGSSAQITKKPFCPVFVCFLHIKSFWVFVFSCLSCN
jgi:hypothetical protein